MIPTQTTQATDKEHIQKLEKLLTNSSMDSSNQKIEVDERWAELRFVGAREGRSYHSVCLIGEEIYSYGGYEVETGISSAFSKIQIQNCQEFILANIQIDDTKCVTPGPRRKHSLTAQNSKIYLFGGQKTTCESSNELFQFDTQKKKWQLLETQGEQPLPIDSHCTSLFGSQLIVFGGYSCGEYINTVYSLDLTTLQWKKLFDQKQLQSKTIKIPSKRGGSATAIYKTDLYVFGGANSEARFNDLWKFSLKDFQWTCISPSKTMIEPEPRSGHSMVCYKKWLFIFGGLQEITKERNDIYAFDIEEGYWDRIHSNTNLNLQSSPRIKTEKSEKFQRSQKSSDFSIPKKKQSMNSQASAVDSLLLNGSKNPSSLKGERSPISLNQLMSQMKNSKDSGIQFHAQNSQANALKRKLILHQKEKLLNELDTQDQFIEQARDSSPVTEKLKNALEVIGNQQSNQSNKKFSDKHLQLSTHFDFSTSTKLTLGKKPCARDGQASCLVGNKLFIYGGDRHLMSFNDMFFFDLEKAICRKSLDQQINNLSYANGSF